MTTDHKHTRGSMLSRRAVLNLLLALALLFTQQVLVTHPLAHLSASVPGGDDQAPLPHGKVCTLCLQASSAGDVLVGATQSLSVAGAHPLSITPAVSGFVPPLLLSFYSRGPPALI